ncbi:HAD family hydrolase [Anatilimnocola floriformis]|uniref:HAD family hydrolase n=1 Tax=Anatilimnocola floriformis TaxID=2948575 RepID=UPI0020C4F081|nr:HAD family hydrolase [Anatilimnocola floriformis]
MFKIRIATFFCLVLVSCVITSAQDSDKPLPSWKASPARTAILDFVACAINPDCGSFIPPAERIAVFDNDGTLWCEQPIYIQFAFAIDRVVALAPQHPEWKTEQPFAAALNKDLKAVAASGEKGLLQLLAATHAGMTTEEFDQTVKEWFKTAKHPLYKRPYTELVYLPMVELLEYLRDNGFKTYIVSGGGIEFMRAVTEEIYGIPPEQVIGSSGKLKYELKDDKPVLMRLAEIDFNDDNAGKPVAIQKFIGRRPVLAFGNSDGDYEMLRWVTAGKGPRLGLIVHHTDAVREVAYDRDSPIGRLDRALTEAPDRGWQVVDMKRDWSAVFK